MTANKNTKRIALWVDGARVGYVDVSADFYSDRLWVKSADLEALTIAHGNRITTDSRDPVALKVAQDNDPIFQDEQRRRAASTGIRFAGD